jgi:hypothetical protein
MNKTHNNVEFHRVLLYEYHKYHNSGIYTRCGSMVVRQSASAVMTTRQIIKRRFRSSRVGFAFFPENATHEYCFDAAPGGARNRLACLHAAYATAERVPFSRHNSLHSLLLWTG